MSSYKFPVRLPNPADLYTPDAVIPAVVAPAVPMQQVVTFPGLFAIDRVNEFHPVPGINFIFMKDMIHFQALFAARQFLTARCIQYGLGPYGVSEGNPFITAEAEGTIACLYSELSLLSATFGIVMYEIALGARRINAQTAYQDFTVDISMYAPWMRFPNGVPDVYMLVQQSQAKLNHLKELTVTYFQSGSRFRHGQRAPSPVAAADTASRKRARPEDA